MCDILAVSAGYNYVAQEYMPIFAEKAKQNMSGWGIGFFRNGKAFVERSSERVFADDQVHEGFQRLARIIDSRIIVSHISCPLSSGSHSAHNNPFVLPFLDHVWLFVNVGKDQDIETYQTSNEPRLEADVKAARVFEYLRDQLTSRAKSYPYTSLYGSLRDSIRDLLTEHPGRYTFLLANESVLFAFSNFRQLLLLRKSETLGDVLLVTSVGERLSPEDWLPIQPAEDSPGKLLVIAGPDVLYLGDV
ncbi:MAG: class II glutamine amidotransferase [Deltaproteobacteria bacterium]|nr:MAG: class II glutamine amidotransferase [Deltaproteobacteria bacterium]